MIVINLILKTLSHHGLKLVNILLPFKDPGKIQIVLIGQSLRQYSNREQIWCTCIGLYRMYQLTM